MLISNNKGSNINNNLKKMTFKKMTTHVNEINEYEKMKANTKY